MRLSISYILLCITVLCSAQGFKVRPYFPDALNNDTRFIFETSPGNYIGGGLVVDTVNGFTINRLAIMGLGSNGQVLWTKKYGNEKLIYVNNPFITRSFYKHGNFIYYACNLLDSTNKYIGGLIKFNFNGDTLWQKYYRDPNPLEDVVPQMISGSVDGGFLMTGFFQNNGTNPYRKSLLIKTDNNGDELWRKKLSPPNAGDGKAIIQDSASKKIVIVGYKYASGNSLADNVLILDSLGNVIGQPNFNSYGGWPVDLIQTKDKNFVYVGRAIYPQTAGGTNLAKAFAVKFDLNNLSAPIWKIDDFEKLELTNYFHCIRELENEDLLIGGVYDTMQLNNMYLNYYIRLTKFDKNGVLKSNRHYDYKSNDSISHYQQSLVSLELTSDGGCVAAIKLTNIPTPNPFFFVKYDGNGCDSSAAHCATLNLVGVPDEKSKDLQIKIYPNPIKDFLNIKIQKNYQTEDVEMTLIDVNGEVVKKLKIKQNDKLDVSDLTNGLYLLILKQKNEMIYKMKIIKE